MSRRRGSTSRTSGKKRQRKSADAAIGSESGLRLGKRGVYLISGDTKVRSFRVVDWEQIMKTLQA